MELRRLVALARLSPPQAVEVGASVLALAAEGAEPAAGGPGGDALAVDAFVVGADGRVALAPAGDDRQGGRQGSGPAGGGLGPVLAQVAGAARLDGRPADPAAERLLAELDRAVADLPVAGLAATEQNLREAVAAVDRTAARTELAALVRALGAGAGQAGGAGRAGVPSTAAGGSAPAQRAEGQRAPALRSPAAGRRRTAGRRAGAWLLSLVVLAGVVLVEVAVLRDRITTDIGLLLDAGRNGSSTSAAPTRDGQPIVPPAPAAAGSVSGVDLRPLAQCAPAAPCSLRLLVRVVPAAGPQVVNWTYRIVDRCTGITGTAPGGSVTVPPRAGRATAVVTVVLPAGQAVGVVAVTGLPAVAASSPVLVGSCTSRPTS